MTVEGLELAASELAEPIDPTVILATPDAARSRMTVGGLELAASELAEPIESTELLADRLAVELATAWRSGRSLAVEEILEAHPQLRDDPLSVVRLIYEETCLRRELGVGETSSEVLERFRSYRDELSIVLEGHRWLASDRREPAFPRVGDAFEGATLLAELGRGGGGRVFLATQADLADRPVVLKVTPDFGDEHLTLARLQHTHVVPLYGAWVVPEANLRVLCMPYLGHTTLARMLGALRGTPPRRRTGSDLVRVIEEAQAASPVPLRPRGPSVDWLARASYVHAICWTGACLAQALHYAHERGLVHLDVKPSNVLLAADGTPMLLDFHLARSPIRAESSHVRIGGTPDYMSPEQARALDDVRAGRAITAPVDERSDVYSLGLILYEALGGPLDERSDAPARGLQQANPDVSPSLAALIARCLARDPQRRYPDALTLAEDLHRHLADQPLRGVANRSLRERAQKWRRRRPHAPALLAMGLAVLVAVSVVATSSVNHWAQQLHEAESAIARVSDDGEASPAAVSGLEHALALAQSTPGGGRLARRLAAELQRARSITAAARLRAVLDRVRFEWAADAPDAVNARAFLALCDDIWATRDRFLNANGRPMPPDLDRQVREDLLDLAVLSAGLALRPIPGLDASKARKAALRRLDEAEALLGTSAELERQRAALAQAEGLDDLARTATARAATRSPQAPGDDYRDGLAHLRAGEFALAALAFEKACKAHPQAFWPNFHRGLCAERTSRHVDAVEAFSMCIAARAESAPCYTHRARAWQALGRADRAERDYDRAVELDPKDAASWINRGAFRLGAGRYHEAIADLQTALRRGGDPATVHYNLALSYQALGDRASARLHAHAALKHSSAHAAAGALLADLDDESE